MMGIELRALKADDMFPMFAIVSKIGLKDLKESLTPERLEAVMSELKQTDSQVDTATLLGVNVVLEAAEIIMRNLPSCKDEIYSFLAGLSNRPKEEIGNLGMAEFAELIISVLKKEEFKDFFTVVAKSFS